MHLDTSNGSAQTVDDLLRAGIAAAQAGQRERARDLLMRVVKQDERNVQAWLWLSGVVDNPDEQEAYLENVLTLDPDNDAARRGLTMVRKQLASNWLYDGIAAAQAGQRERARDLLTRVVEQDEKNAQGWLWLSGVVDSLDEREICLENVLTLDPDNDQARNVLTLVREQKAGQPIPSIESVTVSAPSAEGEHTEALVTPAAAIEWEVPPTPRADGFANEYLCPYCAAQTQPEDRKCPACGGRLWVKHRKREEKSSRLWLALTLQIVCTGMNFLGIVLLLAYVALEIDLNDLLTLLRVYVAPGSVPAQVSSAALEVVPRPAFFALIFFFVFSLVVLVGLYLRWKPAYYLFLINGAELIVLGAVLTIRLWEIAERGGELVTLISRVTLVIMDVSLVVAILALVFAIQDDFAFEKRRILLRVDSDAVGELAVLTRGRQYGKRNMWALAAVHLQRAISWEPREIDAHLSLAIAYINLKRYDLAHDILAEARRIKPGDPQINEMSALLDKHGAKTASSSGHRAG